MAYITGFSDNQLIGVDDLNAITKRLVTSGVGDILTDSGSIEVVSLNGITAAVAESGVVPETDTSLKVTKNGSSLSIAPGFAFFNDGSFIEITDTEILSFSASEGYVYLINDFALGVREARVSSVYPTGDFVLLASISSGVLEDARKYARGKLPAYSSYSGYPLYVKQKVFCSGESKYKRYGSFTMDLSGHPLNGIAIKGAPSGTPDCTGICFFDENKNVSVYRCVANYNTSVVYKSYLLQYYEGSSTYAWMTFSCTADGILTVNVTSSSGLNSATETTYETIEFIVF